MPLRTCEREFMIEKIDQTQHISFHLPGCACKEWKFSYELTPDSTKTEYSVGCFIGPIEAPTTAINVSFKFTIIHPECSKKNITTQFTHLFDKNDTRGTTIQSTLSQLRKHGYVDKDTDLVNISVCVTYPVQEQYLPLEKLQKDYLDLLMNANTNVPSDVTVLLQGKRELHLHSTILSTRSPVFCAMIRSKLSEGLDRTVDLSTYKEQSINAVLRYIYGADIDIKEKDWDTVEEILHLSKMYDLEPLTKVTCTVLIRLLTRENVRQAMILCRALKNEKNAFYDEFCQEIYKKIKNKFYDSVLDMFCEQALVGTKRNVTSIT